MSEASLRLDSISDAMFQIQSLRTERRYADIVAITSAFSEEVLCAYPSLLLARAGSLSYLRRHSEARRTLEKGRRTIKASADRWFLSQWSLLLAIQYLHTGEMRTSVELLQDSITAAEDAGNISVVADASNTLGIVHSFRGDLTKGVLLFRRALYAWQSLGNCHGVGMAHHNLAMLIREWGDAREALSHFEKAEGYYGRQGIVEERVNLRSEKALCYADLGDLALAAFHSGHALAELSNCSSGAVVAAVHRVAAIIDTRIGNDIQAYGRLRVGLNALGSEDAGVLRAEILEELAILLRRTASPRADAYYRMAFEAYGRVDSTRHQARLEARFHSS